MIVLRKKMWRNKMNENSMAVRVTYEEMNHLRLGAGDWRRRWCSRIALD